MREINYKNKSLRLFLFVLLACAFYFAGAQVTNAASLYFSPSSGSHNIGDSFSVGVYVSSVSEAMNATEGSISYSTDTLELTSVSKGGSIMSLWVQEPSVGRGKGSFSGIVYNPGYTGSSGKIITLNFKAKAAGTGSVTFLSGSVLANDGQGTNILSGLGSASFTIQGETEDPEPEPDEPTPPPVVSAPGAPKVTSPTHSDPNRWYNATDVKFEWSLPGGITGVNILADHSPTTNPGTRSEGVLSSYTYEDVEDGVWYFHVRLRNSAGWGGISHYPFRIDTVSPERFGIEQVRQDDPTNPKLKFTFNAYDAGSGIGHYEIFVDDQSVGTWVDDGGHTYETPVLKPGEHTMLVKAVDKAGNVITDTITFSVEAIDPPVVTEYPKVLDSGDVLLVKGTTYPNAQVNIWLQNEKQEVQMFGTTSDAEGNFVFIGEKRPRDGIYKLWAQVVDDRGAESSPSEKLTIAVEKTTLSRMGDWVILIFVIIGPLVIAIVVLLFLLILFRRKYEDLKERLRKEAQDAEDSLHKNIDVLRKDIRKQLYALNRAKSKRDLTANEKKLIKKLKQDLDKAEKKVGKEIKDIEKEIDK